MSGPAFRESISSLAPRSRQDVEARTTQDAVIRLLQGQGGGAAQTIADSGIAHFDIADLHALAANALSESEACLERLRLLLDMLEAASTMLTRRDLARIARHAMRSLADYRRWCDLADNAAYYRDHHDVACRVATA
jgi:hypothetical protein